MWLPFERAAGSRQDLSFDGAVPIFLNRLIVVEFLQELVTVPGADNRLEKFIWRMLKCNQVIASHATPSHPIPSHLSPSHPIPSHLIPSQPSPPYPTLDDSAAVGEHSV